MKINEKAEELWLNILSYCNKLGEFMLDIQQSGLILLERLGTPYEITCIPVQHKSATWWKVLVIVEKDGDKHGAYLHSASGKVRLFRQLNSVVDFLKENCKKISKIKVFLDEKENLEGIVELAKQ